MAEIISRVDSGGAGAFLSVSAWEASLSGDQAGNDPVAEVDATTGAAFTDIITINAPITNYGHVIVRPYTGNNHPGYWDASIARFEFTAVGNYTAGITLGIPNCIIQGIQASMNDAGYGGGLTIISDGAASNTQLVFGCIIRGGTITGVGGMIGVSFGSGGKLGNTIIYGIISGADSNYIGHHNSGGQGYAYNNTVVGCYTAYESGYQTADFINDIAQGCTIGFLGTFSAGSDYNLSDLADAPGANSVQATLTFFDAANYKYALAATDTAAQGVGQNLYVDANFPITIDAVNVARLSTGLFDLGALKYVSASSTPVSQTHQINYEALASINQVRSNIYEALAFVSKQESSLYESLQLIQNSQTGLYEAIQSIQNSATVQWEALGYSVVTASAIVPYEARGYIPVSHAIGYEALQALSESLTVPYESLQNVLNASVIVFESPGYIAAQKTGLIECLATITKESAMQFEGLQSVVGTMQASYEVLQAIANAANVQYEALKGANLNVIVDVINRTAYFNLVLNKQITFATVINKSITFN